MYPNSLMAENGSKLLYINENISIDLKLAYLSLEGKKFNNQVNTDEIEFINMNPDVLEI